MLTSCQTYKIDFALTLIWLEVIRVAFHLVEQFTLSFTSNCDDKSLFQFFKIKLWNQFWKLSQSHPNAIIFQPVANV